MPKVNLPSKKKRAGSLHDVYPAIAEYVSGWGWIEVGDVDDFRKSPRGIVARALDDGGMIWESKLPCKDADEAFQKLEAALRKFMAKNR